MARDASEALADMLGKVRGPPITWPCAILACLVGLVLLADSECVEDYIVEVVVILFGMILGKLTMDGLQQNSMPSSDHGSFITSIMSSAKGVAVFLLQRWFILAAVQGTQDLPSHRRNPRQSQSQLLVDGHAKHDELFRNLKTAVQNRKCRKAVKCFEQMVCAGFAPMPLAYALLIEGWVRDGNVESAHEWFHRMMADGYKPTESCYIAMISGYCRDGDPASAESFLSLLMQSSNGKAKTVACTMLIDAYGKFGDVKGAEKFMYLMQAGKVEPSVVSFGAMMDACAKAGQPLKAIEWHRAMLKKGFSPNVRTFTAMVNAYAKAGDVNGALGAMQDMESCGVRADTVSYSSLLDACARQGNTVCAKKVFALMQQRNIRPNIVTYTSLAQAFAKRGMWYEVEVLGDSLEQEGLHVNDFFLYTLLIAYAKATPKQTSKAEEAFLRLVKTGRVELNSHIMSGLRRAVGRSRCDYLVRQAEMRHRAYEFESSWNAS